ncbi:hypothetical protein, partial [Plasmodium yoelii yoelii]
DSAIKSNCMPPDSIQMFHHKDHRLNLNQKGEPNHFNKNTMMKVHIVLGNL